MSSNDIDRAAKLYRAFREEPVRRAAPMRVKLPRAVARMGPVEFIGYMTTHKRKSALYVHHFAPGSRPLMYAGPGRNQLYLIGGRFHVTGLGITDRDAAGRVVDYKPRFDVTLCKKKFDWRTLNRRAGKT